MRRTVDWRFLLALAFALMVSYLAYAGWAGIEESKDKSTRIDTLIDAVHDREQVIELERTAAARERRRLLYNQRLLVDYTKSLADRQAALLEYLHRHGIEIPARFSAPVAPPVIRGTSTPPPAQSPSGDHSRTDRPRHHGGVTNNGHQGHTGNPPAGGPGNSENAPGHNKPPKHHRGHHRGRGAKG
jgi:hypothetical protein